MTESVITVKQEVEAFLKGNLANYEDAVARIVPQMPGVEQFHNEVVAEVQKIIAAYVEGNSAVETESAPFPEQFKVGDKVKLTGSEWEEDRDNAYGDPYIGQIVTITEVDVDNDAVFSVGGNAWYTTSAPGLGQTHFYHYGAVLATEEDLRIKVGDRVRVVNNPTEFGVKNGSEFLVDRIHKVPSPWNDVDGNWYAVSKSGPGVGGVWARHLEKVTA